MIQIQRLPSSIVVTKVVDKDESLMEEIVVPPPCDVDAIYRGAVMKYAGRTDKIDTQGEFTFIHQTKSWLR